MTTTPNPGAADLPEALRRSTAADGKTELFNFPGYPLMVRAVDFNRVHAESEMRRAALLDEMQKTALAAGQATAAQAVVQDDLITIRKPTTSAEMLWLLKLARLVISDVDKTLEETLAPAQPVAEQGVAYAALPDLSDANGEIWSAIIYWKHAKRGEDALRKASELERVLSDQMRAFADATCALRASHGQAPAATTFCWATELSMVREPVTLTAKEAREVSDQMQRLHAASFKTELRNLTSIDLDGDQAVRLAFMSCRAASAFKRAVEAQFPVPGGVHWDGAEYVVKDSHVSSYRCNRFEGQWEAWKARASHGQAPAGAGEMENLQRTAVGWQERALRAERNWVVCRRWAIAGGAPVEKLGDSPDPPFHAALAAGQATAAQPGVVYAELPVPNYPKSGGFPGTFAEAQMHAFADATHTLRAPHGQAPAKPDPAYSAACHLATALFKKHFAHLPDFASGRAVWSLCDSTAGVISQIDNMVSGLVQPPTTAFSEDEL